MVEYMKKEDIFKSIIKGTAILITGSGAHLDVKTPNGDDFPSGINLAKRLYKLSDISEPENPWDLQDAAETYQERFSPEDLVQEIRNQLRVGGIQEEHRNLYSFKWQRVYTTNYDEVPLIATSKYEHSKFLEPVTLNTPRRNNDLENNLCIYINGYIGKLTIQSLNDEFRLTGKSYLAADGLKESEWGAVFGEDIETADCIIIIGLSLDYDLDIKRFIFNKNVIEKTVFIESPKITSDKKRKLERLGCVEPIGMKKFVQEASEYHNKYIVAPEEELHYIYKAFEVYEAKKPRKNATSFEVYDLFMIGQKNDSLWFRKDGKYTNLIFRKKLFDVIKCINERIKVIYLHANLGNGKTLFIDSLKHQLQNKGIKIFTLKDNYQGIIAKDIRNIINEQGQKLVIIENYYNFLSVINQFALHNLTDIQFVFSARTVLYDTRILEVNDILKVKEGQSAVFDLNKLEREEINQIQTIIDNNGLWGEKSSLFSTEKRKLLTGRQMGNSELQGILLLLVNSSNMKKRIEQVVEDIKKMPGNYYDVLILALLIKTMSLNISANDMSKILDTKVALDTRFVENPNVKEILEFSSGKPEFKLKSAVTANAILQELNCNETIIKVLSKAAQYADTYTKIEKYENILKNIISYSHVKTFLLKSRQKETFLINYYDNLKTLDYYKENSFFWLQYSIACTYVEKYDLAQTYLDSAYSWFRETERVVPFQLDTQQAKLNLILIEKRKTEDIKEKFFSAHSLLMKPVISIKDNPVKQILNFWFYTKKAVKEQMINKGYKKEYCACCVEAYNKVQSYLKSSSREQDQGKNNFIELSNRLLGCSIENNL